MELVVIALVALVAVAVAWRCAAFLLGAFSWFLLITIVASLTVGVPVPGPAVVIAIALWVASQGVSRLRRGVWRSRALRGLFAGFGALHAAR